MNKSNIKPLEKEKIKNIDGRHYLCTEENFPVQFWKTNRSHKLKGWLGGGFGLSISKVRIRCQA